MEERVKRIEDRLHTGDLLMQRLEGKLDDLIEVVRKSCSGNEELHKRMFVDNGKPCIQTRLDRNDRFLKIVGSLAMAAVTVAIGVLIKEVMQ